MTVQILIDFLFLIILVCHIVKIKHLQDENQILKEYLVNNQNHIGSVLELINQIIDILKETAEKAE